MTKKSLKRAKWKTSCLGWRILTRRRFSPQSNMRAQEVQNSVEDNRWKIGKCLCLLPPENSGTNSPNPDSISEGYSLDKLNQAHLARKVAVVKPQVESERTVWNPAYWVVSLWAPFFEVFFCSLHRVLWELKVIFYLWNKNRLLFLKSNREERSSWKIKISSLPP